MEHGPSAFAAHSAGGCDESGGVGREEWGGAGYDLEARDGAEGGVSIHDPQARCRSRSKATDADRWRRVSGRVAPRGTVRDEAFGEDRTRKEDRVLERCACRDGSRTAHIRTAATGVRYQRKQEADKLKYPMCKLLVGKQLREPCRRYPFPPAEHYSHRVA